MLHLCIKVLTSIDRVYVNIKVGAEVSGKRRQSWSGDYVQA